MHRFTVEITITAALAVALVGLVLVAGTVLTPAGEPTVLLAHTTDSPAVDPSVCLDASVTPHTASSIDGEARLCMVSRDVQVHLRVDGLTPDRLYVASLSYVEQPTRCRGLPCGAVDFLADEPVGLLEQIGSGVASPSRALALSGQLHDL